MESKLFVVCGASFPSNLYSQFNPDVRDANDLTTHCDL
ncbi:hypothetical protein LINPERHAP1_LOCUS16631 [Linum perenne]